MGLYADLTRLMLATEATPLRLGGVEFWIDASGPWAGQLTFSKPVALWNVQQIAQDVAALCRVEPAAARIVARYAN